MRPTDEASHLVGQMGTEAFCRALQADADVVIAGRACDTAIFAAVPALLGCAMGPAMHMAKIIECASLCCVPGGRDPILATLEGDSFVLESMDPERRATAMSVAAHSLYEQSDPDRVAEPEGVLLVRSARYEEIDDYRRSTSPPRESSERDRGFESLYPSERLLAGRHCRLAEPGRPTGSSPRILCFEHLKRTCASAGRPRRKSRGRLRLERRVMSQQCWMPGRLCSAPTERGPACKKGAYPRLTAIFSRESASGRRGTERCYGAGGEDMARLGRVRLRYRIGIIRCS